MHSQALQDYPLIPKQAYLFFPLQNQIFKEIKIKTKQNQQPQNQKRIIFGNSKFPLYTQFENNKIQQFKEYLKVKVQQIKQPINNNLKTLIQQDNNNINNINTKLLKLLYANKFKFQNAYQNYIQFNEWQRNMIPLSMIDSQYKAKMEDLLKTGIIYVSPVRDQYVKPIIVVHVGRLLRIKPDNKLFLDTFGYFLQTIIQTMFIDGQIQTWNVIVDVDYTSVLSFAGPLYDLIRFLSKIFIGRMYRCYILNHPFIIKFVWGTVSLMMDQEQNNKCKILDKRQMLEFIPKECLEVKYGGLIDDIQNFWPIYCEQRLQIAKKWNSQILIHWLRVNQNQMISKQQYYKRYLSQQIGNKICKSIIQQYKKQNQNQNQQSYQLKNIYSNSIYSNQSQFSKINKRQYQQLNPQQLKQINNKINKQISPKLIQEQKQIQTAQFLYNFTQKSNKLQLFNENQEEYGRVSSQDKVKDKIKGGQKNIIKAVLPQILNINNINNINNNNSNSNIFYVKSQTFKKTSFKQLFQTIII